MKSHALMLGAGHTKPERKLKAPSSPDEVEWTTLDINRYAFPDIVFDLNQIEQPKRWWKPWQKTTLPFGSWTFDEIHAYSVFEHYGKQGDWRGFFRGMRELWRILKPGGYFIGGSPAYDDIWAWGDPGHTRVLTDGTFSYLDKKFYDDNLGCGPATDYREFVAPCWWQVLHAAIEDIEADGRKWRAFYWGLKKIS
jgi:SAM-dependent methyltransferase